MGGPLSRTRVIPGACAMGHWMSFAIFSWTARADAASALEVVKFGDQLMEAHPRISPVHVVESGAGLPTSEARDVLLAPVQVITERMACVGLLLPEGHIAASMMRVFMRATRVILRGRLEMIVESRLDVLAREVVEVHFRRTAEQFAAVELAAAIQAVRRLGGGDPAR